MRAMAIRVKIDDDALEATPAPSFDDMPAFTRPSPSSSSEAFFFFYDSAERQEQRDEFSLSRALIGHASFFFFSFEDAL